MVSMQRLVAVVGPAGSGKSSLLRAGLVPPLQYAARPSIVLQPSGTHQHFGFRAPRR
jgi:ABC-type sulfate/molybdate transport systems ATPase subunit